MKYSKEPIAIIGMACRYPGAVNTSSYWRLIATGKDALSEPFRPRLFRGKSGFPELSGVGVGGLLEDVDCFDADFFDMSPREAACLDPQLRLLLEVSWEAFEDAGLTLGQVKGARAGVFTGVWAGDFENNLYAAGKSLDLHSITGIGRFPGPNRVSYALDLRGPSMAIDTACSSSLVAVHLACQSIWSGESEFALAGGVNAILRAEVTEAFLKANVLTTDRRCKFADIAANGYVRSEGVGMVVLKPLSKAIRDGDPIYAMIRGGAVNSDGQSNHMLVRPSDEGQEILLRDACRDADIDPRDVQYVEAHGTGTNAGDPVELGALGKVYGSRDRTAPCLVGSVKTNIGHTEAAAGVAGLMKVALALWHGAIPASLHFREPNPKIPWDKIALAVQTQTTPWPGPEPHLAGVTAFGLTGTNAHMLLEACPPEFARARTPSTASGKLSLVPLSAKNSQALDELTRSHRRDGKDADAPIPDLADLAYTAALRRTHHDERLVVVVRDSQEFDDKLDSFLRKEPTPGTSWGRTNAEPSKVAFVFPGQGAQWTGMGRQLFRESPVFRDEIERCDAVMRGLVDWSLLDLFTTSEALPERIDVIQPALFAVSAALARQWSDWGVKPDAVVGHSMGEVAAAYVAGALSLADAAEVICRRSALMNRVRGLGSMAMVELPMETLAARISAYGEHLSVAASNDASSTVLSGDTGALQRLLADLKDEQIFCRFIKVDVASHSAYVDPIRDDLLKATRGICPRRGAIPIYSTVRGTVEDGEALDSSYWVKNLREPVMFREAVLRLIHDGFGTFVEMSPHPLLTTSIQACLAEAGREGLSLPSLKREEDERASLLATAGGLYVAGHSLDWSRVNGDGRCITMPDYPFQREYVWPDFSATASNRQAGGQHAFLTPRMELSSQPGTYVWEMDIGVSATPYLVDHRVRGHAVFPGAGYLELVLSAAKEVETETCRIEQVQFANALVLPDEATRQVQLTFSPRAGTARQFSINNREPDGSWRVLVTGKLCLGGSQRPTPEPLASILAKCTAELNSDEYYRRLAERGLQYGPAFQLTEHAWRGPEESLVRIQTARVSAAESTRHLLHPAILDAAFQYISELPDSDSADNDTYVPVGFDRVQIFKAPEPGSELFAHATRMRADDGLRSDVLLFDGAGGLVAEMRGLLRRPLQRVESAERCLYDLIWTADTDSDETAKSARGRWLLFADSRGVAGRIASELEALGNECVLVYPAETYRPKSPEGACYGINPAAFGDYQRLAAEAGPWQGIVHLWAADLEQNDAVSPEMLDVDQRLATGSMVLLVRALAECGWDQPPRLWIVTAGLYDLTGSAHISIRQGPIWGLGRVVACEHPELRCASADTSPAPDAGEIALLVQTLLSEKAEDQIAVRGRTRFLARFRVLPEPEPVPVRVPAGSAAYHAAIGEPGNLGSLGLELALDPEPGPGEVAIEIRAAGLNFIDVLKSLGIYPGIEPGTCPALGAECAGMITRIGPGVENLHPGEAVVAVTPSVLKTGLLASHAIIPAQLVFRKPVNLSWEEAATLPLAFLTARYGLQTLAGMRRGERVLIQAGAGGVGLAAIQLAQQAGATVFATAGSEEKRRYLTQLGVEHVFDSRSTAFASEILQATGSAGVDIVLNSLSGEFIDAGISVLGRYGRFVEIGKRDIYENRPLGLAPFRRNLSFFAVDLAAMLVERREQVSELFGQILKEFEDGTLRPLPVTTYPASQVAQMFECMAGARHIGKLALTFDEAEVTVRPARPGQPHFRSNGAYLITGGMGGIGLLVARWMVENGARRLVLTGRSEPSQEALKAIREMQALGAVIGTVSADVSQPEDVRRILAGFGGDFPALRGVVHAAAVVEDELIAKIDLADLTKVMAPKAYGAWNLHRETAGADLDFFVMFSSIASLLPQPGHGSYAAANGFQDALARYRQAAGKPGLAINWGMWSATGLAATKGAAISARGYESRGIKSLSTSQGLGALGHLIGSAAAGALVAPIDWRQVASSYAAEGVPPVLATLVLQYAQPGPQAADTADPLSLARTAPPAEARQLIESHVCAELSSVLRLPASRIDKDKRLGAMGLDSLMAVTFVRRLSSSFGVPIPATVAFNYPTVSALAAHLAAKLGIEIESREQLLPPRPAESPLLPLQVEELSDEEAINALLSDGGRR
jgi:phthiocerol/phenolphthiocerol synthesis type-I polyketide synthase C